ncbi:MAG: OmpA family protein [Flavobacteriales bacterium]|nr:OmpA family protein [Flavobacteriales bacterium]MDG1780538.1 OmpA family protein [Flavobacteriales bacterium]
MQKNQTNFAFLRLTLTLTLVFGMLSGFAQKKYTEDADSQFERGGYAEAAKLYNAVYSKLKGIDSKGEVNFKIGECYRIIGDHAGAEDYYKKAIGFKYDSENPEVHYSYGEVLRQQNKFDEAVKKYNDYMDNGGDKSKAQASIQACEDAALALDEPPSRYVVEQVAMMNTENYDYAANWSDKRFDAIIFASSRPSSTGSGEDVITGDSYMDLFMTEQDKKGKWSTPTPLNNTVNTPSNEGTICFDSKFKRMYFTRCVVDGKDNFACDIMYADLRGKGFGPAEPLNIIDRDMDDSSAVGHPALTPDDMFLVFASDMPGGFGGKDLWYLPYDKKEKSFGKAVNLGKGINTAGDEMFPTFKNDGTLYFSSTGHPGMGGHDLFMAASAGEGMQFGEVEHLPYPLNSSSDDMAIVWTPEKDQGYLTSDRPGGKGLHDIYEFKMPPLEFRYLANVYDYDTGTPLANAKVTIQGTDGKSYDLTTDGNGGVGLQDGEIIKETTYNVDVAATDYIGTGDAFSTINITESTNFAREYFLKAIKINVEYDLPLVQYPFNRTELLINEEVNSADSLDFLYDLMVRNPNFVVALQAHTDTRGTVPANQKLSDGRAKTCVDYLISKGIAADRLIPEGKGESDPKISDKEINAMATEEEKEAAHQINRRTVFTVKRTDYVPKEE